MEGGKLGLPFRFMYTYYMLATGLSILCHVISPQWERIRPPKMHQAPFNVSSLGTCQVLGILQK